MIEYIGFISKENEICIDEHQPIVRCKDCKHYTYSSWHRCDLYSIAHEIEPDGFCSWGEKLKVRN